MRKALEYRQHVEECRALASRRFGQLLVIERVPKIDRYARFRCRCDCGLTTEVRGAHLRAGHVRSCGCLRERSVEAGAATAVDMVGRVVGRLTVLARAGSQQLYGDMSMALFLCRCRCGVEVVLPGERLRRRKGPKSCGCLRAEIGKAKLAAWRAVRAAQALQRPSGPYVTAGYIRRSV